MKAVPRVYWRRYLFAKHFYGRKHCTSQILQWNKTGWRCNHSKFSNGKPQGTEAVSRQYFHCLGLGLAFVMVLYLETKTVQDTILLISARNLQIHQKLSWKSILDNDQMWRLWPRWIANQPFIPSHNSTVCGHALFSRGYGVMCHALSAPVECLYILTESVVYVTTPGEN